MIARRRSSHPAPPSARATRAPVASSSNKTLRCASPAPPWRSSAAAITELASESLVTSRKLRSYKWGRSALKNATPRGNRRTDVDAPSSAARRNSRTRSRSDTPVSCQSSMAGRSILITGGTGGLGSAVVQSFVEAGWRVAVTWVDPKELEHFTEHERLTLVEADLLDEAAVERAVAEAAGTPEEPLVAVANLVG